MGPTAREWLGAGLLLLVLLVLLLALVAAGLPGGNTAGALLLALAGA
jgi:hypothetical protein